MYMYRVNYGLKCSLPELLQQRWIGRYARLANLRGPDATEPARLLDHGLRRCQNRTRFLENVHSRMETMSACYPVNTNTY